MQTNLETETTGKAAKARVVTRVFGVGDAGTSVLATAVAAGMPAEICVAVDAGEESLAPVPVPQKVVLANRSPRAALLGGEGEGSALLAEEQKKQLAGLCEGADVVFVVAGLGGEVGRLAGAEVARAARQAGALVLGFCTIPFNCEGTQAQTLAAQALDELKAKADGVICLANEKIRTLITENTTVLEGLRLPSQLLADSVRSIWHLLTFAGPFKVSFENLCHVLQGAHQESAFATAEAMGATRSREVIEKLKGQPLLEQGRVLTEAECILVSLVGGPDLTMVELDRVVDELKGCCPQAEIVVGVALDESFRERLMVTVIAARRTAISQVEEAPARTRSSGPITETSSRLESVRTPGRLPPSTVLPAGRQEQTSSRGAGSAARSRKSASRLRQEQLPLDIVSKGRFDKSEPTILRGQDLDVPTYVRRGVPLN